MRHLFKRTVLAMGAASMGLILLATGVPAAQAETQVSTQPDPRAASVTPAASPATLLPVPGHPNVVGWRAANFPAQRAGLSAVYIAPIQIQMAPDSPYHDLAPDELARLNQQFRTTVAAQLPTGLTLVPAPQPDAMRIEITLAGAEMKKDGFNPLNYTPVGFLLSHAKAAAGVSKVAVRQMEVGVRAYDGTGAPLWALTIRPLGQPADPGSALDPADADPTRVPMTPVRLDQMPGYLAAKVAQFPTLIEALPS